MDTVRYSNGYTIEQLKKFHLGELTQKEVAELATILAQRIEINDKLQHHIKDYETIVDETKREIEYLAIALGISVNSLLGYTMAGSIQRIRKQINEPFRSNQRLAELLCRLQDVTKTQVGTGNILDDLETCVQKLEKAVSMTTPRLSAGARVVITNADGSTQSWEVEREV